jgi:hypothetical protein
MNLELKLKVDFEVEILYLSTLMIYYGIYNQHDRRRYEKIGQVKGRASPPREYSGRTVFTAVNLNFSNFHNSKQ